MLYECRKNFNGNKLIKEKKIMGVKKRHKRKKEGGINIVFGRKTDRWENVKEKGGKTKTKESFV
jgi:hypothetical protein